MDPKYPVVAAGTLGTQTGRRDGRTLDATNRDTPLVDVQKPVVAGVWLDREAAFHSCGGSAGPEPEALTGFPIITRPCDPGDHDTLHLVVNSMIPVNGHARADV